ncbi:hypothetical protein NMY22_g4677 [Coprinellus aureogranulatus]|nr:hypothetical protein NMY22_g4677 [Coprinellus aureogranulatus]
MEESGGTSVVTVRGVNGDAIVNTLNGACSRNNVYNSCTFTSSTATHQWTQATSQSSTFLLNAGHPHYNGHSPWFQSSSSPPGRNISVPHEITLSNPTVGEDVINEQGSLVRDTLLAIVNKGDKDGAELIAPA